MIYVYKPILFHLDSTDVLKKKADFPLPIPIVKFVIPSGYDGHVYKPRPCSDPAKWVFSSIFYWVFCCLPCNAPCYYFPSLMISCYENIPLMVDLSCMAAHNSHGQHLLFHTTRHSQAYPINCWSHGFVHFDVYKCTICNFYIHIRCTVLPKRVRFHEFDQHPLYLITSTNSSGRNDIREVCEEGIELKYWFYRWAKCDYSFHVNCIPSVGYLSKVKFGEKISMSCHSHPLTLKRMLTIGKKWEVRVLPPNHSRIGWSSGFMLFTLWLLNSFFLCKEFTLILWYSYVKGFGGNHITSDIWRSSYLIFYVARNKVTYIIVYSFTNLSNSNFFLCQFEILMKHLYV